MVNLGNHGNFGITKHKQLNVDGKEERTQSRDVDSFTIRCMSDFEYYAPMALKITTKSQGLQPFVFNVGQYYLHQICEQMLDEYGKIRIIIVKARQIGFSTYVEARGYWRTSFNHGYNTFILAHEGEATKNLFTMAKRYHENCPAEIRPHTRRSNAKELIFDKLDSRYAVGTARTGDTGRSQKINFFHGCLADGTQVVCPYTYQLNPVEDFLIGDVVRTHTNKIASVSAISQQEKHCVELTLQGMKTLPVICTPNHKWFTNQGKIPVSDFDDHTCIGVPVQDITHDIKNLPFDIGVTQNKHGGGRTEKVPNDAVLDFDLGRIIGLYLAEGSIKWQYKYPKNTCAVNYAVHENDVDRTVEWLSCKKALFKSVTVQRRPDSKTCIVTAYGRSFSAFMVQIAGAKTTKHFPVDFLSMGREFVEGLVIGYLDGDSGVDKTCRKISISSVRPALTLALREALAALYGVWGSVSYRGSGYRNNRQEQAQWTLNIYGGDVDYVLPKMTRQGYQVVRPRDNAKKVFVEGGFAWVPVIDIKSVGKRKVYDFEVDHPDHTFCLPQGATSNSEVAYWKNAEQISAGAMEGIPDEPDTEVFLESTAAGIGGWFYDVWVHAKYPNEEPRADWNGYIRVFVPWHWQKEYRLPAPKNFELTSEEEELVDIFELDAEQIAWRRQKIAQKKGDVSQFQREYPLTPEEAFNSALDNVLIPGLLVARARKNFNENKYHPIGKRILGVDVAREGNDDTCLVLRQGRVMLWYQRFHGEDSMQICGRIIRAIKQFHIHHVCVDQTGGFGSGVIDRMSELGWRRRVSGVHFSSNALYPELYRNKRTEMWANTRDWLAEGAAVPDKDEIALDLCGIIYRFDSTGDRMELEKKVEAKERIGKSPDIGDALALTFAIVWDTETSESYEPETIG